MFGKTLFGKEGKGKKLFKRRKTPGLKAGLVWNTARAKSFIKHHDYSARVSASSPIYLCAVVEYMIAETLELAGHVANDHRSEKDKEAGREARITPIAIKEAIMNDDELHKYFLNAPRGYRPLTMLGAGLTPSRSYAKHYKKRSKAAPPPPAPKPKPKAEDAGAGEPDTTEAAGSD
eukprot:TRINITY_DN94777_c0_g1_i1.p1 TRINITY_DN94777_c0_g1~~TRINITY_DN94777_c0_g1_i1.p1  ORF type:complete len:176 (-),score=17.01 TRINITY_DN94777_c0_g1_i1:406-933(-)